MNTDCNHACFINSHFRSLTTYFNCNNFSSSCKSEKPKSKGCVEKTPPGPQFEPAQTGSNPLARDFINSAPQTQSNPLKLLSPVKTAVASLIIIEEKRKYWKMEIF